MTTTAFDAVIQEYRQQNGDKTTSAFVVGDRGGGISAFFGDLARTPKKTAATLITGFLVIFLAAALITIGWAGMKFWNGVTAEERRKDSLQRNYAIVSAFFGFGVGLLFSLVLQNRFVSHIWFAQKALVFLLILFIIVLAIYAIVQLRNISRKTGEAANDAYLGNLPLFMAVTAFGFGVFASTVIGFAQNIGSYKIVIWVCSMVIFVGLLVTAAAIFNAIVMRSTQQACSFGPAIGPQSRCGSNKLASDLTVWLLIVGAAMIVIPIFVLVILAVFFQVLLVT